MATANIITRSYLLFCCLCCFILPGIAQDDYYIEDFFVDLQLQKDGTFTVKETLKIHFNVPRHGIYRDIPLEYRVSDTYSGYWLDRYFPHVLFIDHVKVEAHKYKKQSMGNGIRLKIGDPDVTVTGDQVYVISYRIANGLLHNDKISELYWNLIGDDIQEAVHHAGFRVLLPHDIQPRPEDIDLWTGSYGSREKNVSYQLQSYVLTGEATTELGRNRAMTVAVRMPFGSVAMYPVWKLWLYHFKYLLLPLFMVITFFYLWWRHGRDTRLASMVAYLPPKTMDPAMAGFAIDIRANKRDALSLIPYFGVNGYLKVDHKDKKGLFARDEITFTKLKSLPENAPAHQKLFFNGLFASGNTVKLSSLQDTFYTTLNATLSAISDAVMNSGFYTRLSVRLYWNALWIVIVLGILNGVYCFFSGRFIFLALTLLITIVLAIYAWTLLKRSRSGDALFLEIRGFRKFIELAEKDKLAFLVKEDPSYFDKTLPYAIAFDCAEEWCKKFKDLELTPPQWYSSNVPYMHSTGSFNALQFNEVMSNSLSEMRTVMSSSPSSSSSSSGGGGGGGGFSGGGFGGGGVSSW